MICIAWSCLRVHESTGGYHQSEGFPERDILSLCVIPPWDLPGWESCWDAAVAVVVVAVGVTWYQYYQYAHLSDITIHPKFKK